MKYFCTLLKKWKGKLMLDLRKRAGKGDVEQNGQHVTLTREVQSVPSGSLSFMPRDAL